MDKLDKILDYHPQNSWTDPSFGREPSLRELVLKYYQSHNMDEDGDTRHTHDYISSLVAQFGD